MSKARIKARLVAEDWDGLLALAREKSPPVVRYLLGRLSSAEREEKFRAVEGLGRVVEDPELFDESHALELMRRLVWAMNDESGTVPYGMPEAIAEICMRRPELRGSYVPILGSFLVDPELLQTGPIERGVVWGLGRVGPLAIELAEHGVEAIRKIERTHEDAEIRDEATRALAKIQPQEA